MYGIKPGGCRPVRGFDNGIADWHQRTEVSLSLTPRVIVAQAARVRRLTYARSNESTVTQVCSLRVRSCTRDDGGLSTTNPAGVSFDCVRGQLSTYIKQQDVT